MTTAMNRRWFLGAVGSVVGALVAPVAITKATKIVEIERPEIIPSTGISHLMHQLADSEPVNGLSGFGAGCIWEGLRSRRLWINMGTRVSSRWHEVQGEDRDGFLKMVLEQRTQAMPHFGDVYDG